MDDGGAFSVKTPDRETLFGHIWPAENPVAVMSLVHGFGEHSARYLDMASFLNRSGISVVTVDLRGHGRSSGRRGVTKRGMTDYLTDLQVLLDKSRSLYPRLPHILYGHSMGGGIVLRYGFKSAKDITSIIASAPLLETPKPTSNFLIGLLKFISKFAPSGSMAQPIDGSKVSTILAEQTAYEEDPLNHGRMGFATAAGILSSGKWVKRQVAKWHKPLLILHARKDKLTSFVASEAFSIAAANAEFIPFENVAHEVHNDVSRDRVYGLMRDFVLKHAQANV